MTFHEAARKGMDSMDNSPLSNLAHIAVCICTYKRPFPLKRLLTELNRQQTGGLFTYSIVVADNDIDKSAESTVIEFSAISSVPITYCIEPRRSIALARNKVIENASGDYFALIDDDEYPSPEWLQTLFSTCNEYRADGVLGSRTFTFDGSPPAWLLQSLMVDRPVHLTGKPVNWRKSTTANVFFSRNVLADDEAPFRPEFRMSEDQDFFKRKIEAGWKFIWSSDATVFEVVPAVRWKKTYWWRRALLSGSMEPRMYAFGIQDIAKSMIAVLLYTLYLPCAFLLGQYRFMKLSIALCSHLGKLLALVGIYIVRVEYVTE
jgi:succinoglycan biosynthesis protein ExoM